MTPGSLRARAASRLAALALGAMLAGCAALRPDAPAAAPPPPPPPVVVVIEAPDDVRQLLDTHLDLARLVRAAGDEPISDNELRRLENATPAQARALLATLGYMDAQVTTQRAPAEPPDTRPRVRVQVAPGTRTSVASVDLQVAGPLGDEAAAGDDAARSLVEQWRSGWTLQPGGAFSNAAWRDAKNNALARLRATGYAAATWDDTAAAVDGESGRAALSLRIASGPRFHLGEIVIEGLERQDPKSVRNLADFERGAVITEQRLLDFQERLQRAGLFEGVSVTLDPDPARADAATVQVRVREAPMQQATVGVGISANSGARLSVEHLHRNIGDLRATLRNKLEWGTKRTAWEGELASHALEGLYRNLLGGTVESIESDSDRVMSSRVRLGRSYGNQRIDRLLFVEAEHARVRPFDDLADPATRTDTTALSLNFHGTWRNLDSILLPTRGTSVALESGLGQVLSADASGPVRPSSGPFGRLHLRAQVWQPIGDRWYAQARLEAGQVFARDAVAVPETQRFRAGGDDSVRGYAWRSLTPQVDGVDVGGRVVATGSVEIARPVSERLPNVWWAAFIDAGRAAESWKGFSPAWGYGAGVRWRSPVGPLRADVAYGEEEKRWRLHLSVGIAF